MSVLKNLLKSKWLYIAVLAIAGVAGVSSETVKETILSFLGMD